MENNLFPVLKECRVNVQCETGEDWGGLERCGFTEKQLQKSIYVVSVSLFTFYDENGNPDNDDENELLVIDPDFFNRFEFSCFTNLAKSHGAKQDPEQLDHWFTSKSEAVFCANCVYNHLKTIGYNPIKKYE
jgi:hypothetical protein